jgi:hypothetical protein
MYKEYFHLANIKYYDTILGTLLSRLVYKGSMACVSERRRPNNTNPEDLV